MSRKPFPLCARVVVLFMLLSAIACWGQITSPTYDQIAPVPGVGHDYIKLLNETVVPASGSVSIRISVPVPPGRGLTVPFSFGYDSNSAHHSVGYGDNAGNGNFIGAGGWSYVLPTLNESGLAAVSPPSQPPPVVCKYFTNYMFQDMQGTTHALGLVASNTTSLGCPPEPTPHLVAGDPSVMATTLPCSGCTSIPAATVTDHDGTVYYFGNALGSNTQLPTWIEDRNGNRISLSGSNVGSVSITDTLGRTAINASGFGIPGTATTATATVAISGLSTPYTVTWNKESFNWPVGFQYISDPFGSNLKPTPICGYVQHLGVLSGSFNSSGSVAEITKIALPNGQSYRFEYLDPQSGMITKLIYPNGGYIRYIWGHNLLANEQVDLSSNQANIGCQTLYDAPALLQRFVSYDGTTEVQEQDFSYQTSWAPATTGNVFQQWTSKQTKVITKDLVSGSNSTIVYNYSPSPIAEWSGVPHPDIQATQVQPVNPVESSVLTYDANSTLLQTVTKLYTDNWAPPTDVITKLDNGQSSEVKSCYQGSQSFNQNPWCANATGNYYLGGTILTDEWRYDFDGSLLRHVHADYNSFTTPLFPSLPSILDRPSDVIFDDGSNNKVAETDYIYDQGSVSQTSASGHDETNFGVGLPAAGNNRGNVTTRTVKCFIGSNTCSQGNPVTTYAFDETGQVVSMTDPIGNASGDAAHHTTTYSYADNFTDNGPIGSDAYLTEIDYPSTTNISGAVINHSVKFSYAYADGQLASSTDENGNATSYAYNDSLRRLTSTILPDGGETDLAYDDSSANVTTTTKINANASATTLAQMDGMGHVVRTQLTSDPQGTVYTDTAYDGLGRAYKVSNPYRNSNDPIGTKTTYYDALGRVTQTVEQDGSATTISYSGNQTTSVDEAGNPRRKITDALGRLFEVDEANVTNPITAATQASGPLVVNGSLLSKNNYASGTITINGSEQCKTYYAGGQGVPTQLCDMGRVYATINGVQASVQYEAGTGVSSPSGVASALAGAIMTALNGSVSAIANNNVITITAINGGPCCNYSFSVTSTTNYPPGSNAPVTFSPPSFSATASGSSLTGGATIYDSGTAVLTVGSTTVSATYGAGSTANSVAGALAQGLSGSPFSGNVNGSTLTLISNAAGPAGNVSASLVSNSSLFGNGSGSFSGSGALGGGSNSHVSLTQSYVTRYQYDALGNLLCAIQKGTDSAAFNGCGSAPAAWRPRSFAFDSMSHLLSAQNPESGKITYTYDPNGNVTSKTDARGLTINYSPSDSPIDALNRVTKKEYSDGAKPVSYAWDATSLSGSPMHNQIGRLTYQTAGGGGTERFDYDVMGRLTQVIEYENLDTNSPSFNAAYDLAGNMNWIQYPDSRQLTYTYNAANRLTNVAFTGWNGSAISGLLNYWTANSYFPNGTPQQVTYGNGVTETMALNNRMQPAEQKVNNSLQTFLDHAYSYCHSDGDCTEDNGNVMSIADKLNPTLTQTFTYDWLNRTTTATEGRWGQSFQYDPWGNLIAKTTTKGAMNSVGLQIGNNNQVTTISYNNLSGIPYTYDANGNLAADDMRGYTYDEENRIAALGMSPGLFNGAASYSYDPDGNRVTKVAGGATTEYVYFKGQPMAELNPASGDWSDYIFAGGRRIAKADNFDTALHIWGTNCMSCGWQESIFEVANPLLGNYVIQNGDKLYLRQSNASGSRGGLIIYLDTLAYIGNYISDVSDQDGDSILTDSVQGYWHSRVFDLSAHAGHTIERFGLYASGTTTTQNWDISFDDITIVSADGTVHPIYERQASASMGNVWGSSGVTRHWEVWHGPWNAIYVNPTTTYYHGDQIGSSRLIANNFGFPIWQGTFLPFGEEYNPQSTISHYKFSGKERDTESNNDYFGARYYDNNIGRWMTADWAAKATTVPYASFGDPQTLNLYGFVANNPLNKVDADGHCNQDFSGPSTLYCTDGSGGSGETGQNMQESNSYTKSCGKGCTLDVVTSPIRSTTNADGSMTMSQSQLVSETVTRKDGTATISAATIETSINIPTHGDVTASQNVRGAWRSDWDGKHATVTNFPEAKTDISVAQAYNVFGGSSGYLSTVVGYQVVSNQVNHENFARQAGHIDSLHNNQEAERGGSWGHVALEVCHLVQLCH